MSIKLGAIQLDALETGTIEMDEVTQRRFQHIKSAREALLVEIGKARQGNTHPAVEQVKPSQLENLGKRLREKLLANDTPLAKAYLNLLVDEIMVEDKQATIKGGYAALASTLYHLEKGQEKQVPSFIHEWRARRDSNSRPPGS